MDGLSRKRPAASTSSGSTSRHCPQPVSQRWYWQSPQDHTRPLLKTINIVAPLSGEILTVFNHYGENSPGAPEHPANIEFLLAVEQEHPPPDEEHKWIIIDPETMEELEPTMDIRAPHDKIYAVLQKRDRDAERKKRALSLIHI